MCAVGGMNGELGLDVRKCIDRSVRAKRPVKDAECKAVVDLLSPFVDHVGRARYHGNNICRWVRFRPTGQSPRGDRQVT
jgi:hypothetical protein